METTTSIINIADRIKEVRAILIGMFPQENLILDIQTHTYRADDVKMYSVSSILEPIGVGIKRIPREILDRASAKGTKIHDTIDNIIKGLDKLENHKDNVDVVFFFEALRQYGITPVISEFKVWDTKTKIAGTIDLIGINNEGKLCLIDLKTGSVIKKQHNLQLEFYNMLLSQCKDIEIVDRYVIYTNAKQMLVRYSECFENDFAIIGHLLKIFEWNKENKEI